MIHKHPRLPFIEIGTQRERVGTLGWTADQIRDACIELDEWWFTIDGESAGCSDSCPSAEMALHCAESYLFDEEAYGYPFGSDFVEARINSLVESGDIQTALNLAELRGEWAGRSQVVGEMQERYQRYLRATSELSPWPTFRCTQASLRTTRI